LEQREQAETRVYLLRGWFGVFSTGLHRLAAELRGKGIKAETMGHLAWKTMVSDIIKWRPQATLIRWSLSVTRKAQTTSSIWLRLLQHENRMVRYFVLTIALGLALGAARPVAAKQVRAGVLSYDVAAGWAGHRLSQASVMLIYLGARGKA
jgi:hypothetical protein